jgi:hypothetical protein
MGLKTHEVLTFDEKSHYAWLVWCPACNTPHSFDNRWTFDGNHEQPTFVASMLVHESPGRPRCHSHLTNGVWNYGTDCTHDKAGQSIEVPDWTSTRWGGMDAHGVVKEPKEP